MITKVTERSRRLRNPLVHIFSCVSGLILPLTFYDECCSRILTMMCFT